MNDMTHALKTAGVALPSQSSRLWQWIKDHPRTTATNATKALGLTMSAGSSLASQMEARGMLTSTSEYSKPAKRFVKYYTAVGQTYEPKPWPKSKKKTKPVAATPHVVHAPHPGDTPLPTVSKVDTIVDGLTVRDARELYLKLKEMFK